MKLWAICMILGGVVEAPPGPPIYLPLDLTAVMNANPHDTGALPSPEPPLPETPFVFIEAERAFRAEGATEAALEDASGGAALKGLANRGDWAEWAFDLPYDSDEAVVHIRAVRADDAAPDESPDSFQPFTVLAASVNERAGGVAYVPSWPPPNGSVVKVDLGRVRMGRQLLRLSVRSAGEPVAIDCLWVAPRPLDIRNELGENGRMKRPHSMAALVYEPGRIEAGGIPFDLIDPGADGGLAIALPGPDGLRLDLGGKVGDALLLLGAGLGREARATVTLVYANGEEEEYSPQWPALHSRQPAGEGEVTVPMGQFRRATVRRVPLQLVPLESVRVRGQEEGRFVLLAATLAHAVR